MADTTNGGYTYTTTGGDVLGTGAVTYPISNDWKRVDVADNWYSNSVAINPATKPEKDLLWATIELTDYIKQQAAKRGETTVEVLEAMLVLAKNILAVEDKADEHGKEVEK